MREIVFNERHIAKEVTGSDKEGNPDDGAENIINSERAVMHIADTGDEWRKGADNWHEPGEKDGFVTMFLIKFLSFLDVLRPYQAIVPGN